MKKLLKANSDDGDLKHFYLSFTMPPWELVLVT
jgi:hypothetical protein